MSDISQGPGWWQASDGKWYAPETHPDYRAPEPVVPPAPSSGFDGPPPAQVPPGQAPPAFGGSTPPGGFGQAPGMAAAGAPAPADSSGDNKNRMLIAGGVLGALVLLIGAVGFFVLGGDDDDDSGEIAFTSTSTDSDAPSTTEASGGQTETTEASGGQTETTEASGGQTETTAPAEGDTTTTASTDGGGTTGGESVSAEGSCVVTGVDSFDDIQVQISIAGPFDEPGDIWIDYVLNDGDVRFGDGFLYLAAVSPGEQIVTSSDSVTDVPAGTSIDAITCEIGEVSSAQYGDFYPGTPTDVCTYMGVDDFGDMQFQLEVTNSTGQSGDMTTNYGVYADGVRIVSGSHYADAVSPGDVLRVDVGSFQEPPAGLDENSVDCRVLSFDVY